MNQQINEAAAALPTPPQGKKKKGTVVKIIFILLALLVLAGAGFGASILWANRGGAESEKAVTEKDPEFTSHPMHFTVNLAEPEQRRYLRVTIELGYDQKNMTKEIEKKEAELRDIVINILRTKSVKDISSSEGTESLRLEITKQLDNSLIEGKLREVYFTEFLIQ
ncbi:flagellar basal body-associated FliL family protein [Candidatus Contubernalis alkaliaceticus]|uniref:flagellar basal body-associated FliL family protein n=1 Tax=Candidatus Contubernalis alkaliaceticus TaxID=338645 RepID=UPI001F4C2062|nr:flagellar basal body-associated FliL family protein [Candidatus Contubernalis alkalaceticus]UNC91754.1 flagellar basal body-associated FliL family protein [Candidatus Contubernalis alkalaceticus]